MSKPDYIPRRDSDCRAWALNFAAHLSADPARYGVSVERAAAGMERAQAFELAMMKVIDPATRTSPNVAAKDDVRRALVAQLRQTVRLVKAHVGGAASDLINLGLPLDGERPHPAGPPESGPTLTLTLQGGYRLKVRLADPQHPRTRQKPRGTVGAGLWIKIGGDAPRSTDECQFAALATSSTHTLQLTAAAGTHPLYVIARWFDTQGKQSPAGAVACGRVAA